MLTIRVFYGKKYKRGNEWKNVHVPAGWLSSSERRYALGLTKPHYPVPAIPLQVRYPDEHPWAAPEGGYMKMIYIDALNYGEDDPQMVCCWDFYNEGYWKGKYQSCYIDAQTRYWDRLGVEWRREEPEQYIVLIKTTGKPVWTEFDTCYADDLLRHTDDCMAEVERGIDYDEMSVISLKTGKKVFGYTNQDGLVAYLTNWFGG